MKNASEFKPNDGTLYFYGIISSIIEKDMTYLDLGAGRGAWFEQDTPFYRRKLRLMRGKVREMIAADVDPIVLENRSSDRNVLINEGKIPLEDSSVDIIVADYVVEHIDDAEQFATEINRLLKPGGWFCARTPHKLNYVAIGARILPDKAEDWLLSKLQPKRQSRDVFPKAYRLNTLSEIRVAFPDFADNSFIFRSEPGYTFGSRPIYSVMDFIHRILPSVASGNIYAFLRKPNSDSNH